MTSHFPPEKVLLARRYETAVRWFVQRVATVGISSRPEMFMEALEEGWSRTDAVVHAACRGAKRRPEDVEWVKRGLGSENPETREKVMKGLAAAWHRLDGSW